MARSGDRLVAELAAPARGDAFAALDGEWAAWAKTRASYVGSVVAVWREQDRRLRRKHRGRHTRIAELRAAASPEIMAAPAPDRLEQFRQALGEDGELLADYSRALSAQLARSDSAILVLRKEELARDRPFETLDLSGSRAARDLWLATHGADAAELE